MKRFEVRQRYAGLSIFGVWDTIKNEWIDKGCKSAMEALARLLNRED